MTDEDENYSYTPPRWKQELTEPQRFTAIYLNEEALKNLKYTLSCVAQERDLTLSEALSELCNGWVQGENYRLLCEREHGDVGVKADGRDEEKTQDPPEGPGFCHRREDHDAHPGDDIHRDCRGYSSETDAVEKSFHTDPDRSECSCGSTGCGEKVSQYPAVDPAEEAFMKLPVYGVRDLIGFRLADPDIQ